MRLIDGQLKLQGLADSDNINIQCLNAFPNIELHDYFSVSM